MTLSSERKPGILERGLEWDARFNNRLGVLATGLAFGAAALNVPIAATFLAVAAAGNFATSIIEKRVARSFAKRRLGKTAIREDFTLAA